MDRGPQRAMRLEPPDIVAIAELVVERYGPQAGRMRGLPPSGHMLVGRNEATTSWVTGASPIGGAG
jgi:hypothetical protein